jgi:tetratricopeptide (TPR) repeat protein/predicted aspartyl protease
MIIIHWTWRPYIEMMQRGSLGPTEMESNMSQDTGRFRRAGRLCWKYAIPGVLALSCAFPVAIFLAVPAEAACKLLQIAELPVTMANSHPMVTATINGTEVSFIADSGAFYSMLTPGSAEELKLRLYPAPFGLRVMGVGGNEASVSLATVKEFTLAGVPIRNVEFLVGGSEVGGVGVLGQNVFRIGDVEYDLAKGVIRLMREDDCRDKVLAYWASGTAQVYSVVPIDATTPQSPHTTGEAYLNGAKIRVVFDTGAGSSILSERAARRAGVNMDGPGISDGGYGSGIGRRMLKTSLVPVASFKIGDEEIRNTRLRVADSVIETADMLIGADFFLSHHVFVASKQRRLYFTYNGGPVFNLATLPAPASAAAAPAATDSLTAPPATAIDLPATPPTTAADSPKMGSPSGEPKNAAEYARRGNAFASRRDFAHAIEDLTRACELAPDQPDYFYERGLAWEQSNQPVAAIADFGRTISLMPNHIPALVARAELRLLAHQNPEAIEDLNAADRAATKEADARLRMALAYTQSDLLPQAITQLDSWIAAHDQDSRLPQALTQRCWARALIGQDLGKGLDDCNLAAKRLDKANPNYAFILNSRGFVRLRLGDYDVSIKDFDVSLAMNAKNAWALYGRGIDKVRRGRVAEGQADMSAAAALSPEIAADYEKRGVSP